MSRAAKGADCKSAGYAFVGSSPTSPTSLRALRALRLGKPAVREGCRAGARTAKAGDADAPNRFPLLRRQRPDSDVALLDPLDQLLTARSMLQRHNLATLVDPTRG